MPTVEEIEKEKLCKSKTEEANSLNLGEALGMGGKEISSPGASCEAGRDRKEVE